MPEKDSTSGVQELIDRLSQEGVAEGEKRAEEIIQEARQKADHLLETARREASQIVEQANRQADHFRTGGEEALKLACRDAVRDLASRLHEGFRNRLQELVRHELRDVQLLRQMILEIVRKAKPTGEDAEMNVLLPPQAAEEGEIRKRIQAGEEDALTQFVQELLGDEVRKGFTVGLGEDEQTGLRVQVANQNVEIDFTEESISELLAQHLLPRFRAVMHR
jgi:V/A-type H+-transporting ATPase subunit E